MDGASHIICPEMPEVKGSVRFIEGAALADYRKYLSDESRREGTAAAIVFPVSTADVSAAVVEARRRNVPITVSNARTGIAAGAVPQGGLLLSLERMNRILGLTADDNGTLRLHCEAGVPLTAIQNGLRTGSFADSASWSAADRQGLELLKRQRYTYPPDPTESGAAIGGTIACNASGAHTFRYGPTRPYVAAITVVLMDGRVVRLARGQHRPDAEGRFGIRQPDGTTRWGQVPTYPWPRTKNAGGYYSGAAMDLLDLFVGSEGTLGVITEAEVTAIPAPEANCAVMTFWPDEKAAVSFTRSARQKRKELGLEALEYFGPNALRMLRDRRASIGAVSGVPECLPETAVCGIYLDVGTAESELQTVLADLCELVSAEGGDPAQCWSAMARDERERLRIFRHALPETVNGTIAEIRRRYPTVTKLGTDMAVPDEHLERVLELYRSRLAEAGLTYVIFGHIGDNHLHVNIIPGNPEQYALGWELYHEFAQQIVAMGGSPAAEHGIGKLKRDFLTILYGPAGVRQMQAVKEVFDPDRRLGLGTLFSGDTP